MREAIVYKHLDHAEGLIVTYEQESSYVEFAAFAAMNGAAEADTFLELAALDRDRATGEQSDRQEVFAPLLDA